MNKVIVSFLVTSFLASCGNTQNTEPEKKEVRTFSAENTPAASQRSYSFISQPYHTSELSFRIGGPILKLDVQSGQFFRKGQIIAEVDNRDYVIRNERAKAVFGRAEADYNRISNLFKRGNISESSYEKAKADYEQAKANFSETQNNLKDTKLTAPFDGYVQTVHAERFQDIKPSMPVVTFIDLSRIKIEAFVSEDVATEFRNDKEKSVEVIFNTMQSEIFTPSEIFISQSTATNNISYSLTAIINNKNHKLWGGMSGKMRMESDSKGSSGKTVSVPQSAVCHDPNYGSFVWKVKSDNSVVRCKVETGRLRKNNRIEILKGLEENETIAVSSLQYLTDGEQICVNE